MKNDWRHHPRRACKQQERCVGIAYERGRFQRKYIFLGPGTLFCQVPPDDYQGHPYFFSIPMAGCSVVDHAHRHSL